MEIYLARENIHNPGHYSKMYIYVWVSACVSVWVSAYVCVCVVSPISCVTRVKGFVWPAICFGHSGSVYVCVLWCVSVCVRVAVCIYVVRGGAVFICLFL